MGLPDIVIETESNPVSGVPPFALTEDAIFVWHPGSRKIKKYTVTGEEIEDFGIEVEV